MTLSETGVSREKELAATADRLAEQVGELLAMVPNGEPLGLLIEQAQALLTTAANDVSAYGFSRSRFEALQDAAAVAYSHVPPATRATPAMTRLAEAIRG